MVTDKSWHEWNKSLLPLKSLSEICHYSSQYLYLSLLSELESVDRSFPADPLLIGKFACSYSLKMFSFTIKLVMSKCNFVSDITFVTSIRGGFCESSCSLELELLEQKCWIREIRTWDTCLETWRKVLWSLRKLSQGYKTSYNLVRFLREFFINLIKLSAWLWPRVHVGCKLLPTEAAGSP